MARLVFEEGRVWSPTELPDGSLALDGAVEGPLALPERRVFSFDHHGDLPRHALLATCEQVLEALTLGLDPRPFRVYLNDVDADSTLAAWLLLRPRPHDLPARLRSAVRAVGRVDALGPAAGAPTALHRALWAPESSPGSLARGLWVLRRWWRDGSLPTLRVAPPSRALWVERGRLRRGLVQGFAGLYEHAAFGVLVEGAAQGSWAYTVARRSEWVAFDVPRFLARCRELEPGWGGASTVGGAPRRPGGVRSYLSPDVVGRLLLQVAKTRG